MGLRQTGRRRRSAVCVDEVDGILDFRELLDQPRPLAGEHLLAFGDARLVEERKGRE